MITTLTSAIERLIKNLMPAMEEKASALPWQENFWTDLPDGRVLRWEKPEDGDVWFVYLHSRANLQDPIGEFHLYRNRRLEC